MPRLPYIIAALVFGALVLSKFDPQTGFSQLLRIGETWRDRQIAAVRQLPLAVVENSHGYDGQFYAQIATDPTLRNPEFATAIDAPPYRARRILVPATAYILGIGQTWSVLQAYALINVACWAILACLLYRALRDSTPALRFARWFACLFSMGALESVRQSLVDLPALLLLLLTVRAYATDRTTPTTVWSALGLLAKETNLLATVALAAHRPFRARTLIWLAASIVPLACWVGYVFHRFPPSETGTGNFAWPLLGAFQHVATAVPQLASGNWDGRYSFGLLAVIGLYAQAGCLCTHRDPASAWWRIGIAYALLLLILGTWVWSGYWAACRAMLPMTFAFNLLLPANRSFWPLWIIGNATLLHGIWRFL